jgi:hypothetical protein
MDGECNITFHIACAAVWSTQHGNDNNFYCLNCTTNVVLPMLEDRKARAAASKAEDQLDDPKPGMEDDPKPGMEDQSKPGTDLEHHVEVFVAVCLAVSENGQVSRIIRSSTNSPLQTTIFISMNRSLPKKAACAVTLLSSCQRPTLMLSRPQLPVHRNP